MAMRCDNCNKGSMWGHRVSHAKNRSNHKFKPNLQKKTFEVDGKLTHAKLCTNCIKLMKKIEKEKTEAKKMQESLSASV